jgi:hypothetical protein
MFEIDIKFIASEIVRSMTNFYLTKEQQEELLCRTIEILRNKLQIKEK